MLINPPDLIEKKEALLIGKRESLLENFCEFQSRSLADLIATALVRIVYFCNLENRHRETVGAGVNFSQLDERALEYLRSERWLSEYYEAFAIAELFIESLGYFTYICPIGYRHNRPEYIQVLTAQPLSIHNQRSIQQAAIGLDKYRELYLQWGEQFTEARRLQKTIEKIGHQVRNSIACLCLSAHNLSAILKDSAAQSQAQLVSEGIERLDLVLTESMNCQRSTGLQVTAEDLKQLVCESIDSLQPLIAHKQINISISASSTYLNVDRVQMKQIFENILINAIYFSPVAGKITCDWQIYQQEILIQISDQGAGISPEDLPKIFNPFYSRRKGGTGLGLAISKQIALAHGGNIWAKNLPTQGAQFLLILPL